MRVDAGFGLAAAAAAALLAAGVSEAPRVLRRLDTFEIRNVEVRGLRHLAPHQVLEAAGIDPGANLFDDAGPWRSALLEHALIRSVDVKRRLPGTVVFEIGETEPVLLVATPTLVPVDAGGLALPIAPGHGSLDLPVLRGDGTLEAGRLARPAAAAAVAAFDRIRRLDPALGSRVSEVTADGGTLALRLRRPLELAVLLDSAAPPEQLRRLAVVLEDVKRLDDGDRVRRVDARFDGQVVVATEGRPGGSR
ncbi:MAG: FtsQ-type POTRA domain-containing protein [Gemmatimonadota bacterium]